MEPGGQLWQFGTLVVEPIERVAVTRPRSRTAAASCVRHEKTMGRSRTRPGSVLLRAPLRKAYGPSDVAVDVTDAEGRQLGESPSDQARPRPRALGDCR